MTDFTAQSMVPDPQLLPTRLRRFLEPFPAKEIAQRVRCDVRTAENMKAGHWPISRHWAGLVATFGRDITECVFHPEAALARFDEEERKLADELERVRARRRLVAEGSPGDAGTRTARPNTARAEPSKGAAR